MRLSTAILLSAGIIAGGVEIHDLKLEVESLKEKNKKVLIENKNLINQNHAIKLKLDDKNKALDRAKTEIKKSQETIQRQANEINELKRELNNRRNSIITTNNRRYVVVKELTIKASAYSQSDEEQTSDGITKLGTHVQDHHTIAVDPNVIPLGSLVYIESDSPLVGGYYVAQDTGGAIKGNRIDIFMSNKQECFEFGMRNVKVKVLKEID